MPTKTTQRTTPAQVATQYQLVPVTDLSGGLDLRTSPTHLAANRARTLRNMSLAETGALTVRSGYLKFSSQSLGASKFQGGERVYLSSYTFTILAWNGGLYTQPDNGSTATLVYSTISATAQAYFPYNRDFVAVFDGTNPQQKSTNGSSWTHLGITGPTSSGVASSIAGSLSSGEFELSWTYKDRDLVHESNMSTLHSTITLTASTGGGIKYVVANSTDPQVEAIVVYARHVTDGESVLRVASSGAQSTGANSTFTITSSVWTLNAEGPTDHDVAPVMSFAKVWKNRWWGVSATRGNRLHFSQIFNPQSWPSAFYLDLPFERGDSIAAIEPQGDTLLVFGQSARVYLILGQTSLDFEVRPAPGAQAGALGPRATEPLEQGVVHAAAEGIYLFDGVSDRLLTYDIDPGWVDLIRNANQSALQLIDLVYAWRTRELRCAVPRLYPRGVAGEWVLDLNRVNAPAWTDTDRAIHFYIAWNGAEATAGDRGRLFSASDTSAILNEENRGTSANSSNLTAEYEGPTLTTGLIRSRIVDLRGEYEPHSGSFSVETVIDGVSQGVHSVNIGAGLTTYGTGTYGTGTYAGTGRRMFFDMQPLGALGRTMTLKATYLGQDAFRLFTYSWGLVPEPQPLGFSD